MLLKRLLAGLAAAALATASLAGGVFNSSTVNIGKKNVGSFLSVPSAGSDPYWSSVKLLVANNNGTNGSTAFIDQSTSAKTVTTVGAGTVWSNTTAPTGLTTVLSTNGATTEGLTVASSADFGFGTGDFTIEGYWYKSTSAINTVLISLSPTGANPLMYTDASGILVYFGGSAQRITGSAYTLTTWHHVAVSRVSGSTRMFVDGAQVGSTYVDANSYATTALGINNHVGVASGLPGYAAAIRVTTGVGRYTGTFTPPSLPLPTR